MPDWKQNHFKMAFREFGKGLSGVIGQVRKTAIDATLTTSHRQNDDLFAEFDLMDLLRMSRKIDGYQAGQELKRRLTLQGKTLEGFEQNSRRL
ncbi:MAG: hypothetical protein UR39_C0007G0001 [Candidatus Woesebacteria bacterium GW2011_GWA1_33_30]|uniref:Uncharacterized protein n=1 Tax=Candidatus Woesebacteria bacterium GW2011_GWA2_33_28 TaxID=1618561 RepID=A0A0F9ZRK3_9BACT|nr:MAG: hypothetical protein UR38_C0007G0001 [Candidatus Woesebacteria bacterium GW2011_GWA2_33_28]KKP47783.1 MAG: hypothetical protein UR39_C0007G0001 [Candidatus Woesebacteria bacterium GW2011_GWA1_33_30]KKP49228.1 MAG: hypothetical protein UR40_C0008G0001 [Microgenomates group bacterium GW2011_GWC1_33_32]KKP56151.1 MAG: hypothetical protein UR48_C0039G0010 [Microgenomates group bacterium GW2011_GWD1_33_9]